MKIKKITAFLSVLTMLPVTGMPVHAENTSTETHSQDIKAIYQTGEVTVPEIFSVDITWGSMEFTYNSGGVQFWNVDTLKYEITEGDSFWVCEEGANEITVTNNSNFTIQADLSYSQKNDSNINGTFDNSSLVLEKYKDETSHTKDSAVLSLNGELADTSADRAVIGDVTASIRSVPLYEVSSAENNYKTVNYTSTDGNTYECLVYSSTPRNAVLVSTEFYCWSNKTGVLGYDKQEEDLARRGGRMPKFKELQILLDSGMEISEAMNFNCQEYEVAWVNAGVFKYQTGNDKYRDSIYMPVFDVCYAD